VTMSGNLSDGFICCYCNKQFATQQNLCMHLQSHTGESAYRCDDCYKAFDDIAARDQHVIARTCRKPYVCGECDNRFSTKFTLQRHMKLHISPILLTDKQLHTCSQCLKSFEYINKLAHHSLTHMDQKEFVCDACDKSSTSKDNVECHVNYFDKNKRLILHLCKQ